MATFGIDFSNREALTGKPSDNGAISLQWESDGDEVEVQQDETPDFKNPLPVYGGPENGSVVTGLREGEYFFRIRLVGESDWSPPLAVRVQFISRSQLFLLLSLGAVVVVATIVAIVAGYRSSRTEGGGE